MPVTSPATTALQQRPSSRGIALAARLFRGFTQFRRAPIRGARSLPILTGLNPQCIFLTSQENTLIKAGTILADSGKIFVLGDSLVYDDGDKFRTVSTAAGVEQTAVGLIANIFICEENSVSGGKTHQFPPPRRLIELLAAHQPTLDGLPHILNYARHPVFDSHFHFRGPGWHREAGLFVHSIHVEPARLTEPPSDALIRDRLPHHLSVLLAEFCFKSDADIANAVGILLTGVLMPNFVKSGKPIAALDGNQPGVGKTLKARSMGIILDGEEPEMISFTTDNEELGKRICAGLRNGSPTVLLLDNAKTAGGTAVSSPLLEAQSTAPKVSLRILGKSETFQRPNDFIWVITMNMTSISPDLVSRAVPIRFEYPGDPKNRRFDGPDPIEYARSHRAELLGELAGMVMRWNEGGRLPGSRRHRFTRWSEIVGGVMEANHLPEFLSNLDEAAGEFDAELASLAGLAEHVSLKGVVEGRRASEWRDDFHAADLLSEAPTIKNKRSQSGVIGTLLGKYTGRSVNIEVNGRTGSAVLVMRQGRSNSRLYHFDFSWDGEANSPEVEVDGTDDGATPPRFPLNSAADLSPDEPAEGDRTENTDLSPTGGGRAADGNDEVW